MPPVDLPHDEVLADGLVIADEASRQLVIERGSLIGSTSCSLLYAAPHDVDGRFRRAVRWLVARALAYEPTPGAVRIRRLFNDTYRS